MQICNFNLKVCTAKPGERFESAALYINGPTLFTGPQVTRQVAA